MNECCPAAGTEIVKYGARVLEQRYSPCCIATGCQSISPGELGASGFKGVLGQQRWALRTERISGGCFTLHEQQLTLDTQTSSFGLRIAQFMRPNMEAISQLCIL